jgi:hypothetical protein
MEVRGFNDFSSFVHVFGSAASMCCVLLTGQLLPGHVFGFSAHDHLVLSV